MSTLERQHDLEQNALAAWIVQLLDAVRPHLVTIIGGGLALAIALVAWGVFSSTNAATEAQSWDAYQEALTFGDPAAFTEVIERYPDSEAASWAQLVLADRSLAEGTGLAFADRATSQEQLESAADLYTAVLADGPDGLLAERAAFGLAKARESLGQLDEAKAGYAGIVRDFPESPLAAVAQEHADALSGDAARDWYDWFFAQNLQPVIPPTSGSTGEADENPAASDDSAGALFDEGPLEPTETETTSEPPAEAPDAPGEGGPEADSAEEPAGTP
jgi:predicted negative regulator of RcsB-dependent stress response